MGYKLAKFQLRRWLGECDTEQRFQDTKNGSIHRCTQAKFLHSGLEIDIWFKTYNSIKRLT